MITTGGPAALIERWANKEYTVTRTAPRTYTAGRATAAQTTTLVIKAHWQPAAGGRVGELLSSGTRVNEAITLWTRTLLLAGVPGKEADQIAINGKIFEVQSCEAFDEIAGFYKAELIEV